MTPSTRSSRCWTSRSSSWMNHRMAIPIPPFRTPTWIISVQLLVRYDPMDAYDVDKRLAKLRDLSAAKIAENLDKEPATAHRFLNGHRRPTADDRRKLDRMLALGE